MGARRAGDHNFWVRAWSASTRGISRSVILERVRRPAEWLHARDSLVVDILPGSPLALSGLRLRLLSGLQFVRALRSRLTLRRNQSIRSCEKI